jgi:hypothetical protein
VTITIKAESNLDVKYGMNVEVSKDLVVKILPMDVKKKDNGSSNSFYFSILILIIILMIIIIIIILIYVRKKTSKKDADVEESQEIPIETPPDSIATIESDIVAKTVLVSEQQQDQTIEE